MLSFNFCLWLAEKLIRKPMTLEDIRDEWSRSHLNETREYLNPRTFYRYRQKTEELLGLSIECNRSDNTYSVKDTSAVSDWLVSSLRVHNLSALVKEMDFIMLENPPAGSENLEQIVEACKDRKMLRFRYKSPYRDFSYYTATPLFIRLFRQRWYVTVKPYDKSYLMTLALDRMDEIAPSGEKVLEEKLPGLTAWEYFADSFGVIHGENPQRIVVRAFWPQDAYLMETPLHESQRLLEKTENWSDFELRVSPTYDFKQELLWNRDKLVVISPQWLRDDMMDILQRMMNSYRTGRPDCKDE